MSAAGLFIVGVLVTLIVAAAMALLLYAAILDGRDAAARRAADREPLPPPSAVSILQTARAAGSLDTPGRGNRPGGLERRAGARGPLHRLRAERRGLREAAGRRRRVAAGGSPKRSPTSSTTTSSQDG